jgi:hypothetical protein
MPVYAWMLLLAEHRGTPPLPPPWKNIMFRGQRLGLWSRASIAESAAKVDKSLDHWQLLTN